MTDPTQSANQLRVLFVCTANICRSPMAAAVLSYYAHHRGLPLAVASAGAMNGGKLTHEHTQSTMAEWNVDLSAKVSRTLTPQLIGGADLIIGMETKHARRSVGEHPPSASRIFLFKELAAISERLGPRLVAAGQTPQAWLRAAHGLRTQDYTQDNASLEIPDPIGEPAPVYTALREEFAGYSETILNALYPAGALSG